MTTRSGKRYLPGYMCHTCHKFWGHEVFDFKCSHCATNGARPKPIMGATERLARLEEWILTQKIIDPNHSDGKKLLSSLKRMGTIRLYLILQTFKRKGYLLRAEDARELLEHGCVTCGHVIASCVIDWWNIKTASAGGNWPSYLVCYYGDYDAPPPKNMPPRGPRSMLSCTETIRLRETTERILTDMMDNGESGHSLLTF